MMAYGVYFKDDDIPTTGVFLYRGSKSVLENKNIILKKYQLIVELPDDFKHDGLRELFGKKFKYKIGDGVTPYKDLPYEEGTIPVAFIQ